MGAELLTAVFLLPVGLSECAAVRVVVVADLVGVEAGFLSLVVALLVGFLFADDSFAIDIVDAVFLIVFAACLVDAAGMGLFAGFSTIAGCNNSCLASGLGSGFVSDFSVTVDGCTLSFTARDASFAVTLSTLSP
jgi:hypothetical protein